MPDTYRVVAGKEWRVAGNPGFFGGADVVAIRRASDGLYLSQKPGSAGVVLTEEKLPGKGSSWVLLQDPDSHYYEIRHLGSSMVLDVRNQSRANGAVVGLWEASGADNQKWELGLGEEGSFFVLSRLSKKALDVIDGNSDKIGQWDFWGGPNQLWRIEVLDDY